MRQYYRLRPIDGPAHTPKPCPMCGILTLLAHGWYGHTTHPLTKTEMIIAHLSGERALEEPN